MEVIADLLDENINYLNEESIKDTNQSLKVIHQKLKKSVTICKSSEGILNYLMNDMVDYAHIKANKFMRMKSEFNLKECIDEVLTITQFKAEYLRISIKCSFSNFG